MRYTLYTCLYFIKICFLQHRHALWVSPFSRPIIIRPDTMSLRDTHAVFHRPTCKKSSFKGLYFILLWLRNLGRVRHEPLVPYVP